MTIQVRNVFPNRDQIYFLPVRAGRMSFLDCYDTRETRLLQTSHSELLNLSARSATIKKRLVEQFGVKFDEHGEIIED